MLEPPTTGRLALVRLYVLRSVYFFNFTLLGFDAWSHLLSHRGLLAPIPGIAYSFWAALAALSGLGVRLPFAMLPLVLLQLLYKLVWLWAVGLPAGFDGPTRQMSLVFVVFVVLELFAVPWRDVLRRFVAAPADRWR